jgi:two-component system response regulator FixJ
MDKNSVVHVVDDDKAVREGIANLVEDMGLKVETYPSAEEFLARFHPTGLDCLLLDVRMTGMSGMELLTKLSEMNYRIPTVIISGHGDIPMAVEAIEKGAVDFIEKPFGEQILSEKIQKAFKAAADCENIKIERQKLIQKLSLLTDRERCVLKYFLQGDSNKEIAIKLGVTIRAVAFHRASIFKKLEITSIVELAKSVLILDITI